MVTPPNYSFGEALSQYVAVKKSGKKSMDGHQDIGRFIAWIGRERMIRELTPSEVADYAQQVGLGGSEAAVRIAPEKTFLAFLKEQGWVETSLASHLRIPRHFVELIGIEPVFCKAAGRRRNASFGATPITTSRVRF